MFSSSLCFLVLVCFSCLVHCQSDPYLIGGWQSSPSTGSDTTDYIIFNNDGTFSALFDNAGIYGTYSVNQNQNPWWLDLNIEAFNGNNAPSLYSHPLQTPPSGQSKQLYLAIPFNRLSIFTGTAQRPTSMTNATLYYSTSFIPSFTTTTTTGPQTTGFGAGNSGGTTWTNCPDCQNACHDTCMLAQVGRKRCQKKCQRMLCSKVC